VADNGQAMPYFNAAYDTKRRFCSYWHQIDEINRLAPASLLEVGIGNGFVSGYLRGRGVRVTTADIDPGLKPDHVASVLALPFPDRSFAAVMCCEVLEHLPYEHFAQALRELRRVSQGPVVVSLPDRTRVYQCMFHLPWAGTVRLLMPWFRIPRKHRPDRIDAHAWEIGVRGYPRGRITAAMREQGLRIIRTYRVFEHPRHRFFILDGTQG